MRAIPAAPAALVRVFFIALARGALAQSRKLFPGFWSGLRWCRPRPPDAGLDGAIHAAIDAEYNPRLQLRYGCPHGLDQALAIGGSGTRKNTELTPAPP